MKRKKLLNKCLQETGNALIHIHLCKASYDCKKCRMQPAIGVARKVSFKGKGNVYDTGDKRK